MTADRNVGSRPQEAAEPADQKTSLDNRPMLAGWQGHRRRPTAFTRIALVLSLVVTILAPTSFLPVSPALALDTAVWDDAADFSAGTLDDTRVISSGGDGVSLDVEGAGLPNSGIPWWDAAWGQRRCVNVTNGGASALSEFPIEVLVNTAVSIGGGRMNANGDDIRFIAADGTTELPYWIGAGLNSSKTTIWVQADTLPVGTSTICMYYDNPAASPKSDHLAPFTYTTPAPLYVGVQDGAGAYGLTSYVDGNNVSVGTMAAAGAPTTVNAGASIAPTVGETGVVWANGPLSSRGRANATDALVPLAFAGTRFAIPSNRGTDTVSIFSPYSMATVNIYEGTTLHLTVPVPAGTQVTDVVPLNGAEAMIVESNQPVLVFYDGGAWDSMVQYPAGSDTLYGVPSTRRMSTGTSTGTLIERTSTGVTDPADPVARGVLRIESGYGSQGTGPAVAIILDSPTGVASQADSDGLESTILVPQRELNSMYYLPDLNGGFYQYVTAACYDQGGTISFDGVNRTCGGSGGAGYPGFRRETGMSERDLIESTDGTVFMIQSEWSNNDESNVWGPVQGRKGAAVMPTVAVGGEESPYLPTGTWTSATFTHAGLPYFEEIAAVLDALPANGNIQFQIATAQDVVGPFTFLGPDGTAATFYGSGPETINAVHDLDPHLQVRAFFTRGDSVVMTPVLRQITITSEPLNADLSITKSDSADPVTAGEQLSYTIEVSNAGLFDAENVVVTDTLPASGASFVSASVIAGGTGPCSEAAGVVTCPVGDLLVGDTATVEIVVSVDTDAAGTTLSNDASVTSDTPDADLANNSVTETTAVVGSADVSVTKTDAPDPATAGMDVTYVVTVASAGPSVAENVVLTDTLPSGLTFVSATPDNGSSCDATISCVLGDIAADSAVVVTVVASVDASYFTAGNTSPAINSASALSATPDPDATNNAATEATAIAASADVSVTVLDAPDPVTVGEDLTYTVTVSNAGASDAAGVVLDNPLAAGLTLVSATADNGASCDSTVNCPLGTVAAGGDVAVTIVATVDANYATLGLPAAIPSTATVTATTSDPDGLNNTATATTDTIQAADLAVAKAASIDPVRAGDQLVYTVTVTNDGPSDAQNVMLSDPLPAGVTFASAVADNGGTCDAAVDCALATIASGDTVTVTITVTVNASYFTDGNPSPISNTASVSSDTPDPDALNDSITEDTVVVAEADLSVAKVGAPDPVTAGSTLVYTITVTNDGPSDAHNVVLDDPVPGGVTVESVVAGNGGACDATISCTLGTVAAGDTVAVTITATVNAAYFTDGNVSPVSNTVTVATDTSDPDSSNDTATVDTAVEQTADVVLTKTAAPDPVVAGGLLTYTVVVTNAGPSDAQNVVFTDVPPAEFIVGAVATDRGDVCDTSISCTLGVVAAAEVVTITIAGTVDPSTPDGFVANIAAVTSDTPDGDELNNLASASVQVLAPELGLAKSVSAGPVNNGDGTYTFTYTITVENSGSTDLSALQVTDDLSATFAGAEAFVVDGASSAALTVDPAYDGTTVVTLLDGSDVLGAGEVANIEVTVTATPGANLGPYDNSASGTATSPAGLSIADVSQAGVAADSNGDGDPTNDNEPTPISFDEAPGITVTKTVATGPVSNLDGTYSVSYDLVVENTGDIALDAVHVFDDLATAFTGSEGFTVDSVTSSDLSINPGYDGSADTSLLSGTDSLPAAATGTVTIEITVVPGAVLGPYANAATASGISPAGTPVSAASTANVTFEEQPALSGSQVLAAEPVANEDGTHTLTYLITVVNDGDVALENVQVMNDLGVVFGGAPVVVDAVIVDGGTGNPGYDGVADTNLLAGIDAMAPGVPIVITLTVTVTPGDDLGPHFSMAFATASTQAGTDLLTTIDGPVVIFAPVTGAVLGVSGPVDDVDVTDPQDELPRTGGDLSRLGVIGLLLEAMGLSLLGVWLVIRRRNDRARQT